MMVKSKWRMARFTIVAWRAMRTAFLLERKSAMRRAIIRLAGFKRAGVVTLASVMFSGSAMAQEVKTYEFVLTRYNSNGGLDGSFDGDGKVNTSFPASGSGIIYGMAIQADGKIVTAGVAGSEFALARYNTNGSLDVTFDGDGKVLTSFSGFDAKAYA